RQRRIRMAKDLPSFIAQEGAKREGSIIREKNFVDANNYETVAYLKHLDIRNEPKMVLFENVPALNGKKSEFSLFYNHYVTRQYVVESQDMRDIKSSMDVRLEVARRELLPGSVEVVPPEKAPVKQVVLTGDNADLRTLPIPMHQKDDAGAYLTMTCAMKGLNREFYDITFTKNKFYEPRRMSFSAHKHH